MEGSMVPDFGFQVGSKKYFWNVVAADIEDDFILGLDFLKGAGCKLDLVNDCLQIGSGETIHAMMKDDEQGDKYHVSRVLLKKRSTVAPGTVRFVRAKLENPASVRFVLEPKEAGKLVIVPCLVEGDAKEIRVAVVNIQDERASLPRNFTLAQAVEADNTAEVLEVQMRQQDEENTTETCGGKEEDQEDSHGRKQQGSAVRCSRLVENESGETFGGSQHSREVNEEVRDSKVREESLPDIQGLPKHLHGLYQEAILRLTLEQSWLLYDTLLEFADVFAEHELDIGTFHRLVHWIRTGQGIPRRQAMHRTLLGFEAEEKKVLTSMLDAGVIEQSQSEWASPPVLVRKKDKSWRYCIDFRYLNSVTTKDAHPLPLIDECIDSLSGMNWFCALDMNSGYWQIPIAEEDKDKTAFITKYGLFQFVRMPFGLVNAPATFQRAMHVVLSGLIWEAVIVYLDDINVLGRTFEETLGNLRKVLERFKAHGLKLKPGKCALFCREVVFLGRLINEEGVQMVGDHIKAVQDWPVPKNRKDVEKFLGFINYHRRFLVGLAGKTQHLYELTGPKAKWQWAAKHEEAFQQLRQAMVEAPVLALPNAHDPFILDTDASDMAVGAELSQVQDGVERPVAFASKVLHSTQVKYCTTRKELLAVVVFTKQFRHYLLGRPFTIRTDHASLVWLLNFKNPGGQLARWLSELGQYDFRIEHRRGCKHSNADGLSRIPSVVECDCYVAGLSLDTLPCGGCSYCQRVRQQWEVFEQEVDDVVPLAIHHLSQNEAKESVDLATGTPANTSGGVQAPVEKFNETPMELAVIGKVGVVQEGAQKEEGTGIAEIAHVEDSQVPDITADVGVKDDQFTVDRKKTEKEEDRSTPLMVDGAISQEAVANLRDEQTTAYHTTEGIEQIQGHESNLVQQFSPEEMRGLQLGDPELQPLIRWLETGAQPSEAELQALSPNTRHLWLCRAQLVIVNGVLHYTWEEDGEVTKLLIVPRSQRQHILEAFHDEQSGGHLGQDKTLIKIKRRFYWYGMGQDVRLHVATCATCRVNKRLHRHPRAPLQNFQAGSPGDRVHLDILGPFKESESQNKYVLMIIDQFSRWLEIVPLPNQEAETIANAFFETYVVRFGVPFMVHTDQGRNFESKMFKSFCVLMEMSKTRTTPYRPSSNGQVERYNQLVLNFLRCYLAGKQRTWDQFLPMLGMAVRATVNRSTGYTPNMLMLGHEINMPADILYGLIGEQKQFQTPSVYLKFLLDTLAEVHTEVRENIKAAQRRQKRYYDMKAHMKHFDVGDLVYKRNAAFRAGESRKLNPLYTGPYVVVEVLSPALFRVVDQKRSHVMHHDRLKLCEDRIVPLWARRKRHSILGFTLPYQPNQEDQDLGDEPVPRDRDISWIDDLPEGSELSGQEDSHEGSDSAGGFSGSE